jgi:uncharacterized protein involved in exopolysaccharide biosynthesis
MVSTSLPSAEDTAQDISFWTVTRPLAARWKLLLLGSLSAGFIAVAGSFLMKPEFNAKATFLPPQQQQNAMSSALSQLGALSSIAGAGGVKSPADQLVALMQSETLTQRMVQRFDLVRVYDVDTVGEAREELRERARIAAGKKDGLIGVEVLDQDPARAAAMANAFIEELRKFSGSLALTEAQQRRVFFEDQVKETRARLDAAQLALQRSGISAGTLKAEPRAAAEGFAKLSAELMGAEIKLQALRTGRADSTPEVQSQLAVVAGLRSRLAGLESNTQVGADDVDYLRRFREFKYQEVLFDVLSRQYEMARVDEAREGALIQVVDEAQPPERKVSPRRSVIGIVTTLITGLLLTLAFISAELFRLTGSDPQVAKERQRWLESFRR